MTAKRQTAPAARNTRRTSVETTAASTASQPDRERRLVDVDPWAILLEQLMEMPDESVPAERKRGKTE